VHLGAGRTAARVALLDKTSIAPGDSGLAQLVLEAPLGAFHGDRFVLRDPGASRTLAGGTVIEPGGPARRRRTPQRLAVLAALEHPAHEASLERLLPLLPQGLDIGHFCATRNVVRSQLKLPASAVLVGAQRAFEQGHWETFKVQVTAELTRFHTDNEDELGPERGRFRRMLFPQLEDEAWNTLLDELARDKRIELSGAFLHLPGHRAELSAAEQALARDVLPLLLAAPFDPPWVRDIAAQLGADERTLRKLLLRLVRRGEVFQVVRDLFYVRSAVAELSNIAKELQADTGQVLAAEFRDRIGVGRKRAVQILEFFDRIGYLRRVRDAHRVRGVALLGEPPAAPG
jgi:selenocysteine-specific elongation factor